MPELVPIPWQPKYFLTPDTLTMLQLASAHAGHNIYVTDAWRSYAEQKGYRDYYEADPLHHPYASDPDDPNAQNNHMRAAAVDIRDRADRAAMLAVGFKPDGSEWWHFNNPRWASMPIIKTNTSAAGTSQAHITEGDDDVAAIVMQHPKGQMYLFGDNGDARKINSMDEVASLVQTNSLRRVRPDQVKLVDQYWIPASADTIDRRLAIAARATTGK